MLAIGPDRLRLGEVATTVSLASRMSELLPWGQVLLTGRRGGRGW